MGKIIATTVDNGAAGIEVSADLEDISPMEILAAAQSLLGEVIAMAGEAGETDNFIVGTARLASIMLGSCVSAGDDVGGEAVH